MLRLLIFRFRRRRAVSTMIGGVIILSVLLTALGTMVFVSQQNDQYQQSVNKMGQYDSQLLSENLVFNSPGLTFLTSDTVPGWGSGCTTTYICYNMTLSNWGGVGVQIVRIYINSNRVRLHIPLRPQPNVFNHLLRIQPSKQLPQPGRSKSLVGPGVAQRRCFTEPEPRVSTEHDSRRYD